MKKSVLFLLTFIMLLCVSVSCFANQPYKHPDYNLHTVKEIHITKIDNLEGEPARYFKSDEKAETKVLAAVKPWPPEIWKCALPLIIAATV